jgi:PAS domain S-box-containing protein
MQQESPSISGAQDAQSRLLASHQSEDPFAAAFKATRMPMIITDPRQTDNPIIFANDAFCELTGYSAGELLGRNCRILQGPLTDAAAIAKIRGALASAESVSADIMNYRKDGTTFWNALFVSPVRDKSGEVIYFFASQLDFTNLKDREIQLASARQSAEFEVARRTRDLQSALQSKTVLAHEVDHRVKNNLLTIASLLKLYSRLSSDETVKRTLRSVLERVEALGAVQRKLFNADDLGRFDMADFTRELVSDLVGALRRDDIELSLDVHPVRVSAAHASPLALIVNELIGDAVRRGLRDGGGHIRVSVRERLGRLILEVRDTVEPVPIDPEEDTFSRLILESSARQVEATVERRMEQKWTIVEVSLPMNFDGANNP